MAQRLFRSTEVGGVTGSITYNDIVSRLLAAIPEFQPDSEDVTDNLVYRVFGELVRLPRRSLREIYG